VRRRRRIELEFGDQGIRFLRFGYVAHLFGIVLRKMARHAE
jgi:hypothetical protein